MNYAAQKAALTRAEKTGNPFKVVLATARAVAEWNSPEGYWPDDWSRWERACWDITNGEVTEIDRLEATKTEDGEDAIIYRPA
jgi:hypothetical protein